MAKAIDREKLIQQIIKECAADDEPVSRAEAEEMADMTIKAESNGTTKIVGKQDKPRKPSTRERKVDSEKAEILTACKELVEDLGGNITNVKTETEINFLFNGTEYSLKLIKHRPPKK